MSEPDRTLARRLASEALASGQPLAWFEPLYLASEAGGPAVPWADMAPNPELRAWSRSGRSPHDGGGRALVVGCGLGDDAELLDSLGYDVVAFDVAPTAVRLCRRRFPSSGVEYVVADLLEPPPTWHRAFDLVFEANTLQSLPAGEVRDRAIAGLSSLVATGGTLLVVARGREQSDPLGELPWPLTRAEVLACAGSQLILERVEDRYDDEVPPVRRFVATFRHRAASYPARSKGWVPMHGSGDGHRPG
ncbi:MAG: class I SAM-dependent methyltransferase [Actinomycetota bacterium]|nr:class I SAM-dependent methyltransferase [Actinomycetota bacterium]